MNSTLIVARMTPESGGEVARLFSEFDTTEMPRLMGTTRRQLFAYQGLYFHLQDFESDGARAIDGVRSHPLFVDISNELKPFITPYDPQTWRSPADAMANPFYHWTRSE
ncbi:TcmI family type II polyketide cyclase [Amycolatopsis umgeniensis]|uniref:Cyclase n=1 Tax=Amycolatopsis umgeniensis TaxID=336628 RepID=A0A841BFJ8_9PSEU|nr:TcmI family type II polyketide cyclase [Amycolatopsis umgeniensis]MBB5857493.1 cyclase [Amycolatopsis umgeniensis]